MTKKCGTCGKTAYTSERMAKSQAQWIERKGKELRPYFSRMCGTWHLTSQVEFKDYGSKAKRFK